MIAYFDCFSGVSGDMTLGALIHLGVPAEWLARTLREGLNLHGFEIEVHSVNRSGIAARQVNVVDDDGTERNYAVIREMIASSRLPERVVKTSLAMFERLAAAEAQIHGCAIEDVHFHEVGGVDAIVDMVGAALGIDYLGIQTVVASPLPMGSGTVECRHGTLPVPAPATVAILEGVPVYGSNIAAELVTPTGAAIVATLADRFDRLPEMIVSKVGYGAGQRELKAQPNLLRIMTGHPAADLENGIMMVETCIDDMNPEVFGYLSDRLFAEGARDVCLMPVYMKKGRPGTMIQVLCDRSRQSELMSLILTETSAIGVRYYPVGRRVLERSIVAVETEYGKVEAKQVRTPDGGIRIAPEFESCRRVAESAKVPIRSVYESVVRHAPKAGKPEGQ